MSTDCETLASWWDEKQGDEGDLWHRALITPPLFQLLGSVADQRVLDLACGNGYIARRLARQGACVTGVDASAAMIERARAWEADQPLGIVYHVADAARLDMLTVQAFDVVVCNMALMDLADAAGAIHEDRARAPSARSLPGQPRPPMLRRAERLRLGGGAHVLFNDHLAQSEPLSRGL